MDNPDVMNTSQTAVFLQLCTKTVIKMAKARKLPCIWVGRTPRFSRAAIEKKLGVPVEKASGQ